MNIIFSDTELFIGIMTRQLLGRLEEDGDISPAEVRTFYTAVRGFYHAAAGYALANLPLKDELLKRSQFANFRTRESTYISYVMFFVGR